MSAYLASDRNFLSRYDPRLCRAPPSEASVNLIDTPDDRNSWSRASVELHSRCSRSGRCQSALVSRNSKKEPIVSGSICTVSSGMIAALVSLHESRHGAAGVIVTGIMDAVLFSRSWSAEKHAVWNLRCQKVLSIQRCSRYPTMHFW